MTTTYLIALVWISISCIKVAKTTNEKDTDYVHKLDSLIKTTTPRAFNGVILITKGGEIVYSKGYGYSDFEKRIPINVNDLFQDSIK